VLSVCVASGPTAAAAAANSRSGLMAPRQGSNGELVRRAVSGCRARLYLVAQAKPEDYRKTHHEQQVKYKHKVLDALGARGQF
jgi:hypothetical protein